jgi:hypothetical protein
MRRDKGNILKLLFVVSLLSSICFMTGCERELRTIASWFKGNASNGSYNVSYNQTTGVSGSINWTPSSGKWGYSVNAEGLGRNNSSYGSTITYNDGTTKSNISWDNKNGWTFKIEAPLP